MIDNIKPFLNKKSTVFLSSKSGLLSVLGKFGEDVMVIRTAPEVENEAVFGSVAAYENGDKSTKPTGNTICTLLFRSGVIADFTVDEEGVIISTSSSCESDTW